MDLSIFTVTERRILDLLSDGKPHRTHSIREKLFDHLTTMNAVRWHIFNLRAKMEPLGEFIVCEIKDMKTYYRHVRLISRS